MIVGIPKEIKNNENRVGMTPSGTAEMARCGHKVVVQSCAGTGSGFSDEEYVKAGARILETAEEVWKSADMIVKVKEPVHDELNLMKTGQILFTYLHLAAARESAEAMLNHKVVGIAYETITEPGGFLPLLAPMSEVAGRMSILIGARYLMKMEGGRGVLLPGVPGTKSAKVVVIGGGFAGFNAAQMAYSMGAEVTVIEKSIQRIRYLKDMLPKARVLVCSSMVLAEELKEADIVVGAVLIPGACAPKLVTKGMIKNMKKGSVFVDISIDQGGCSETSRPTSHQDPVYVVDGVIHYCVTNMPGQYPRTSTIALTNATLPYALRIANKGLAALKEDSALLAGLNTYDGKVTFKAVSEALNCDYHEPKKLLGIL